MIVTTIPIKCPMCQVKVSHLKFWKNTGGKYFHLCEKCYFKDKTEEDLLNIGWHNGYSKALKQAKEAFEELRND